MLNLWQKNGVFKIEIIQPLLDMAAGASNAVPVAENVTNNEGTVVSDWRRVPDSALVSGSFPLFVCFVLFWLVVGWFLFYCILFYSLYACLFSNERQKECEFSREGK